MVYKYADTLHKSYKMISLGNIYVHKPHVL